MLHAGLDLSESASTSACSPTRGSWSTSSPPSPTPARLRGPRRAESRPTTNRQPVCAVIESMTGARFVHDTLEAHGWSVEIADAQKVKGLAPLAVKTDRIDARVLAGSPSETWCRRSGCPTRGCARERELARFRLHLVKHRSQLKHRIHSALMSFGRPCPVTDLFGVEGRELLGRLEIPEPWRGNIDASLMLIDSLEAQVDEVNAKLRVSGMPTTHTCPSC